jgi:hypothetical protein
MMMIMMMMRGQWQLYLCFEQLYLCCEQLHLCCEQLYLCCEQLLARFRLSEKTTWKPKRAVQGTKIVPVYRPQLVWEPGNDGTSNEINNVLQLPYKRGKRARVCGNLNFTTCRAAQTENWKWTLIQGTTPSYRCTVWLEPGSLKMSHVTIYCNNERSCWSVKGQLTTGLLMTDKYTLTNSLYDVQFRDELSRVCVRRIGEARVACCRVEWCSVLGKLAQVG